MYQRNFDLRKVVNMVNVGKIFLMKSVGLTLLIHCIFFAIFAVPASSRLVVDQTGQKIDLPTEAKRVLALAPSLTEMVYSLQAEDKLVGATSYSNFPEDAQKLPSNRWVFMFSP